MADRSDALLRKGRPQVNGTRQAARSNGTSTWPWLRRVAASAHRSQPSSSRSSAAIGFPSQDLRVGEPVVRPHDAHCPVHGTRLGELEDGRRAVGAPDHQGRCACSAGEPPLDRQAPLLAHGPHGRTEVLHRCREITIRDAPRTLGLRHGVIDLVLRHCSNGTEPRTATNHHALRSEPLSAHRHVRQIRPCPSWAGHRGRPH